MWFTSLSAATAAGSGSSIDLGALTNEVTFYATSTGTPTTCRVYLEGSLDGTNWHLYNTAQANLDGQSATLAVALPSGSPLARFIRARLYSLDGGTSPTVTAIIAAVVGEC